MQITPEVMRVLSALEIEPNHARIVEQLDRKLYAQVDKVLQACGAKWSRKHKAHVFTHEDAGERLQMAIDTGEVITAQELGFFPTPTPLACELVQLADVRPGHFVLEPSAGEGAIVEALLTIGVASVDCIERDAYRRRQLEASRIMIHDWCVVTVASVDDFMDFEPEEPYDRIVMNPPFGRVGKGDHIDHVRHAHGMIVPDGVLVSVLPAGVVFRNDRRHREFREWVAERGGTITPLPDDSFVDVGTKVRTCVLRVGV